MIGGGICGATTAWDACLRGLSVALLERGDWGGATSAESLKVVHGGIRYLQHLDVARVRESSRERSALLRIAPHLVHPMPVVVPTYGHGMQGAGLLGAAFAVLNGLTAGRNRRIDDPDRIVPAAHLVGRDQALEWFPDLPRAGLTGAGVFFDGQMYNPPRLVWEFVRSAAGRGAVAANYCEAIELLRRNGRIAGVVAADRLGTDRLDVRGRVVVNAAGPFAERLLVRTGLRQARVVPFSRDLALTIRHPMVRARALALQTRYRDPDALLSRGHRHIFLVPWRGMTLIGVNSAIYRGDPDELRVTDPEVDGFLEEINEAGHFGLSRGDVGVVMAGLLPIQRGELVGSDVSFGKRALVVDNAAADGVHGLITAICNRYTTARAVARRVVDLVFRKLGRAPPPCGTAEMPLDGAGFERISALIGEVRAALPEGTPPHVAESLARNHGSKYGDVLRLARERPALSRPLADSGVLAAEVVHALRHEMARHLPDCVFRRTDLGSGGHPGDLALDACADLVAAELAWTPERRASELAVVRRRFARFGPSESSQSHI